MKSIFAAAFLVAFGANADALPRSLADQIFDCGGACIDQLSLQERGDGDILNAANTLMWMARSDLAEALIRFRDPTRRDPALLTALAENQLNRGEVQDAQASVRDAIALQPNDQALLGRLQNRSRLLARSTQLRHAAGIYASGARTIFFKFDPFLLNPPALLDLDTGQNLWLHSNADGSFAAIGLEHETVALAGDELRLSENGVATTFRRSDISITEVTIALPHGAHVTGDLIRPHGGGNGLVILTHGAGRSDRFNLYFDALNIVAVGGAAFVYDKPGLGASVQAGNWITLSIAEQAAIVTEAATQLKAHYGFTRVGVWGFSQGGWVAPIAAVESSALSFVVMASGAALSPEEQQISALVAAYSASGGTASSADDYRRFLRNVFSMVNANQPLSSFAQLSEAAAREPWGQHAWIPHYALEEAWWRENNVQPREYLPRLRVPVLMLLGSADQSVVLADNLPALTAALATGTASSVQINIIANARHTFETADDIFAPSYYAIQRDWIGRQLTGDANEVRHMR